MTICFWSNEMENSLFHTVGYKNHTVEYIFHTVGYKSQSMVHRKYKQKRKNTPVGKQEYPPPPVLIIPKAIKKGSMDLMTVHRPFYAE